MVAKASEGFMGCAESVGEACVSVGSGGGGGGARRRRGRRPAPSSGVHSFDSRASKMKLFMSHGETGGGGVVVAPSSLGRSL